MPAAIPGTPGASGLPRRGLRLIALLAALCVGLVLATGARAGTRDCASLELGVHDTGQPKPSGTGRMPVTHLIASGFTCPAASALFRGATVTITGGGGNLGPVFGPDRSMSPKGWRCRFIAGYWAAKDHADTLAWVSGWAERCDDRGASMRFDEGRVTPFRFSPSRL
jgi:hypothetical protein